MLLLLTLLLAPPNAAPPGPSPAAEPVPRSRVQIHLDGFADDPVLAALRLRLHGHAIDRHADAPGSPDLYLRIARTDATTGTMQAITADGRAFDRTFAIEVGHEVRAVATTAVNLLFAIEHGTVPPDQQGVAIPDPTPPPPPPPPQEPEPKPAPKPAPPSPAPEPAPAPPPTSDLALVIHGVGVLGLAPQLPPLSPYAATAGGLGLELRAPRGLTASFELRAAGIRNGALGLARLRIGAGLGYTWRRRRFELPVLLVLAVEPWWPLLSGRAAALASPSPRSPLLSAHLRLAPGLRLTPRRSPTIIKAVRVGPRLELGGGFIVDDGARVVSLDDADHTPRARLGGLELSLGLELSVQFGLPR
jgi:hypothetical protein